MGELLTDEEERIYDNKMSVLSYLEFGFKNRTIAELLGVTRQCVDVYKKQFKKLGWIITSGNTRNQVTKLTKEGKETLNNYEGIIY